jgi:HrpA-like RNA helicase
MFSKKMRQVQTMISAMEHLFALGALDNEGLLTRLGRKMAEFPLEPPLSKCILASVDFGCSEELITIVAMLSVQQVFYRPREKQTQVGHSRRARHATIAPSPPWVAHASTPALAGRREEVEVPPAGGRPPHPARRLHGARRRARRPRRHDSAALCLQRLAFSIQAPSHFEMVRVSPNRFHRAGLEDVEVLQPLVLRELHPGTAPPAAP